MRRQREGQAGSQIEGSEGGERHQDDGHADETSWNTSVQRTPHELCRRGCPCGRDAEAATDVRGQVPGVEDEGGAHPGCVERRAGRGERSLSDRSGEDERQPEGERNGRMAAREAVSEIVGDPAAFVQRSLEVLGGREGAHKRDHDRRRDVEPALEQREPDEQPADERERNDGDRRQHGVARIQSASSESEPVLDRADVEVAAECRPRAEQAEHDDADGRHQRQCGQG